MKSIKWNKNFITLLVILLFYNAIQIALIKLAKLLKNALIIASIKQD